MIAHEVGHHVQNLLGISDKVHALQSRAGKAEANELSVRLELQADFLAGVWANHAQRMKQILEVGDVESGSPRGAPRSATTVCRWRPKDMSSPTRSRTALPNSACDGSPRG